VLTTFQNKMTRTAAVTTNGRITDDAPAPDIEARLARLEAAIFGRPPVQVPVNRAPTPFDARIGATEVELAELDTEMEAARAAWFAVRDGMDAARAKGEGTFQSFEPGSPPAWFPPQAIKDAENEAREAVQDVERRWTRVRSKLNALHLAADRWRGENI
jgi:hypothetical protein